MPPVSASVIPGEGTVLAIDVGSGTFTTVALLYEVDGPEILIEAVDVTALNTGLIKTRPCKFPEPDKASLKIYFDPSDNITQSLLSGDSNAPGTVRNWKITFADADTTHAIATFSGFVNSFKMNGQKVKSNIGADIEIKLTTIITFTAGTP